MTPTTLSYFIPVSDELLEDRLPPCFIHSVRRSLTCVDCLMGGWERQS